MYFGCGAYDNHSAARKRQHSAAHIEHRAVLNRYFSVRNCYGLIKKPFKNLFRQQRFIAVIYTFLCKRFFHAADRVCPGICLHGLFVFQIYLCGINSVKSVELNRLCISYILRLVCFVNSDIVNVNAAALAAFRAIKPELIKIRKFLVRKRLAFGKLFSVKINGVFFRRQVNCGAHGVPLSEAQVSARNLAARYAYQSAVDIACPRKRVTDYIFKRLRGNVNPHIRAYYNVLRGSPCFGIHIKRIIACFRHLHETVLILACICN